MSRVEAAAAMDRLPWLPDEPRPKVARRRRNFPLPWVASFLAAVAMAGFWMGARSVQEQAPAPSRHVAATTTVRLPEARPTEPQVQIPAAPQVNPAPQPQVRPAPAHEVRIAVPPAERREEPATDKAAREPKVAEEAAAAPATKATASPVQAKPQYVIPKPWPARVIAGASGRLVQVGAFGSIPQAKHGWNFMVRAYPAMAHLPAVVRPSRNSKGRTFYRFQIGTTSQAHSEVLCQRMETIHLSCAVVGLPWKSKVER